MAAGGNLNINDSVFAEDITGSTIAAGDRAAASQGNVTGEGDNVTGDRNAFGDRSVTGDEVRQDALGNRTAGDDATGNDFKADLDPYAEPEAAHGAPALRIPTEQRWPSRLPRAALGTEATGPVSALAAEAAGCPSGAPAPGQAPAR